MVAGRVGEEVRGSSSTGRDALLALFRAGHFSELESKLRPLLSTSPASAFHWGLFGTMQEVQGKDGLEPLLRAASLEPGDVDVSMSLGAALRTRGRLAEAAELFSRVLAVQPENPSAIFNIGETWRLLGYFDRAEPLLKKMVVNHPEFVEAAVSYADVLAELGRHGEAEQHCRRVIAKTPDFALAHFCLSSILRRMGRLPETRDALATAIRLDQNFAPAYDSMGCVLQEMGLPAEAESFHRRAIALSPDSGDAWFNLGRLCEEASRFPDAEAAYREAARLMPENGNFVERHAVALHELGRHREAFSALENLLAHGTADPGVRLTQLTFVLPQVVRNVGESASVPEDFGRALESFESWQSASSPQPLPSTTLAAIPLPFLLAYRQGNHLAQLSRFGDLYCQYVKVAMSVDGQPGARIRLLVVSQHIRRHSVWDIVLRGLLMHLDRTRFEVVIYHLGNLEDEETVFARTLADVWRDRSAVSGPEAWLDAARSDRPDVIFYPELGMASISYMMAAHRLAPLQVVGWGHPVTSGLASVDIYFSGELLESPVAQSHYRERLVRLPGTGGCTEPLPVLAEPINDLSEILSQRAGPKFVIAQRSIKLDPLDDEVFAAIAARVPGGTFFLLRDPVAPWATDIVLERLQKAFCNSGADPDGQLVVLPWLSAGRFFSLLDACDVFLDCPSFSGYTTAWQALHRGLPVVTLEGTYLRQRLAAGLLRRIGMSENVATTIDEYVDLASSTAKICQDAAKRASLRQTISTAARGADGDLAVVRAFEQTIIDALGSRKREIH